MEGQNIELIEMNYPMRVAFNLKLSELTDREEIKLSSPKYQFNHSSNREWQISFSSVPDSNGITPKDRSCFDIGGTRGFSAVNNSSISLTIHADDSWCLQECVYQVVASIHSHPKLGIIGFKFRSCESDEAVHKHWQMFSLNTLRHAAQDSGMVKHYFEISCYRERSTTPNNVMLPAIDEINLFSFLEQGTYSDVTVRAEGCEFKAHKLILSARSPVFTAMFQSGTMEANTGVIDIPFPAEVVVQMLRFMYTNQVPTESAMTFVLYAAAHMYELKTLQKLCTDCMCANISVENVTEVLVFAETYSLSQVAWLANNFVDKYEWDVVKREEFIDYKIKRLCVDNVAAYLEMTRRNRLDDFQESVVKFIAANYADVMRDEKFIMLYRTNVDLIMDVHQRLPRYLTTMN